MNFTAIPIIAVLISLVICWALFAILCSLVHEAIAQVLAERGRFMKKYLEQQLQDFSNGVNWATMLYQNGAIDMLTRDARKPTNDIAPPLFAQSLIETVGKSQIVQMHIKPGQNAFRHPTLFNFKAATQVLTQSDVVSFFSQALNEAELNAVVNGVVDEGKAYKYLSEAIQKWYSELTERLSLWYKKKTRQRLFWLGLVLSIILNVDSIQLFKVFNSDPASRAVVLNFYQKQGDSLAAFAKQHAQGTTPDSSKSANDLIQLNKAYLHTLDSLKTAAVVPVGFNNSIFKKPEHTVNSWAWKLLGLLITGLAASFGAPFWFDLLRKVYSK